MTVRQTSAAVAAWMISLVVLGGCSNASPDGVSSPDKIQGAAVQNLTYLPAGENSLSLNVEQWEFASEIRSIRGLSHDRQVVAEFFLDGEGGTVESLVPDHGFRAIDASKNSLTPRTAVLFEAMLGDLNEAILLSKFYEPSSDSSVDKAWLYNCYTIYPDCDLVGFQGILYGWWTGYDCLYPTYACPSPYIWGLWVQ